jgi:hypothetical protein
VLVMSEEGHILVSSLPWGTWGSIVVKTVVSLGTSSVATDGTTWGSTEPLKMGTRILLRVKTAGA